MWRTLEDQLGICFIELALAIPRHVAALEVTHDGSFHLTNEWGTQVHPDNLFGLQSAHADDESVS